MRLLFDQNLSHRLVSLLGEVYPGSVHVREVGLAEADDGVVWSHALRQGLVIVSKDADFYQRSLLLGPPPKVVWIRRGNCSTRAVEAILRRHHADVERFCADAAAAILVLE